MIQYETATKAVKTVKTIHCNCCGKEIRPDADGYFPDHLHLEKEWGYFSQKDGQAHSIDLCEACYDKWVASFSLPLQIIEK